MIVITGQGRSGTTVVAQWYQELGFDPGGRWNVSWNGGLESEDVVRVNRSIVDDLDMGVLGHPREVALPPKRISQVWKRIVPDRLHEGVRTLVYRLPSISGRTSGLPRWDRFDEVVEKYRPTLHRIAASHDVVKDPRFCWTLGVWAAAGVEIEQVIVCLRALEAVVESKGAIGSLPFRSEESAKDSLVYGLGLCMTALYDHRLPHIIIRFPDFLEAPHRLYDDLTFPQPVSEHAFREVVDRVVQPELVHDRR